MSDQQGNVIGSLTERRYFDDDDTELWYRSSRKVLFLISSLMFLLVAAITRTSTGISSPLPPGDLVLLERAQHLRLRRQAHVADLIQEQGAALACSKSPLCCLMADVKNLFMAEQVAFDQSAGIAAQLTSMNGPEARLLMAWRWRATSSLPVPLSPVIITLLRWAPPWRSSHGSGSWPPIPRSSRSLPRSCASANGSHRSGWSCRAHSAR